MLISEAQKCPKCKSDNTDCFDTDHGSNDLWENMVCLDCDLLWYVIYDLTGIELVE